MTFYKKEEIFTKKREKSLGNANLQIQQVLQYGPVFIPPCSNKLKSLFIIVLNLNQFGFYLYLTYYGLRAFKNM